MIIKPVNVLVEALGRTASEAHVYEARDGIVVYDLLDSDGIIAKSRYSIDAESPFVLTNSDIIELNPIVE